MKKILRNPFIIGAVAFLGGVALGDKIKPKLAEIPVIGKLFGGVAE